jgi:hypothetical protein
MKHAAAMLPFVVARRWAAAVGVVGAGLLLSAAVAERSQFFQSYLFGYLFWLDLSLGCLALVMIRHAVGGVPGLVVQRELEAGALTVLPMALLFVPLLVGLPDLYVWARPEIVARNMALQHKALYLNVRFFEVRAAAYFLIWIGLVLPLRRWSLEQDRTEHFGPKLRLQHLSGPGLVLYALTVTFALIDWSMSLDPIWFSTIYGMAGAASQFLTGLAIALVVALLLARREPLAGLITTDRLRDLGNLILAGILFFGYLAFSQFLVIWSGNLPDETRWYLTRTQGGWEWVERAIIAAYAVTFILLVVVQRIKRSVRLMVGVGVVLIAAHLLDRFWFVAPVFRPLSVHYADVGALLGIGGVWMAVFLWVLATAPLVPQRDPQLAPAAAPVRK